ncbi:MAG: DUF4349 domain-containing protein [Bacillota bacterium]
MRKQVGRYSLVLLLIVLMIAGCSAARQATESADYDVAEPASAPDEEQERQEMSADEAGRGLSISGQLAAGREQDQKVILNASISLEVPSPEESMQTVLDLVREHQGFISNANQWQVGETRTRVEITARVPAEYFDDVRSTLLDMGVVTHSRVWSTDVTEEYIDLSARLDNLRSEEEALRRILEQASTVEDMLAVRKHLTDVRGQIESLQGRLRYLDDRVAYSTFTIEIRPETLSAAAISAMGFQNFAPRLSAGLIRGINLVLNVTGNFIIAFVTALPSLLVAAVLIWLLLLGIRALRSRRKETED